ncbi:ribosome maturation factor RimP [Mycoplasmopsis mustelae]|uniref:Ribosome maturation factor RimP n=1 Tax=Mycoplasmopsis mustelae TaxID=171289 RepID=A0A4R7UC26_9BACT|nr:ribosome assembly cofactor RimP [Mycoplasmopsis mustelae]TDV23301.1 ribosome maturation factor RimP [Mycoplasmopsis mustelae]
MDYKQILSQNFKDVIVSAKFIKNDFGETLEVVTTYNDLKDVETISKQISAFLETQTWFTDAHNLEVLSKGVETTLDINNLNEVIGKYIQIKTKKSLYSQNIFQIQLLEDHREKLLGKWNQKGQIRKIWFEKNNILSAELYIKF